MTVQAWIIQTEAENLAGNALNTEEILLGGRIIDNPLANNLGEGTLVGKYVSRAAILNDPEYSAWLTWAEGLPIRTIDSDVLFLPEQV